jgi:hypothetical protein
MVCKKYDPRRVIDSSKHLVAKLSEAPTPNCSLLSSDPFRCRGSGREYLEAMPSLERRIGGPVEAGFASE